MSTHQSEKRKKFNQDFASRYHQPSIALSYLNEKVSNADHSKAQRFDSKIWSMIESRKSACKASGVTDKQAVSWLREASTSLSNVRPFVKSSKTAFAVSDSESPSEGSSDQSSDQEDDLRAGQLKDLSDDDGAEDAAEVPSVEGSDEDGWRHVDVDGLPKTLTDDPSSTACSSSS